MRLNYDQEEALTEVRTDKENFDTAVLEMKARFDEEVEHIRRDVADSVKAAVNTGVPLRQIGFALGTSDHKTIKSYTE